MEIKSFIRVTIVFLIFLMPSQSNSAGVEKQMGKMFNSMVTTTPSTKAINNAQRGVIGLPGITIKNRISSPQLISMVPPSWEAGCGGIDFYGGSFSFISGDAFQGLLRDIASNATGYMFELALGSMCEGCLEIMETLQQKIQKLNQYLGNSCQLAQGLVNGDAPAKLDQLRKEFGAEALSKGVGNLMGMFAGTGAADPVADAKGGGITKRCAESVNLLWCEMQDSNIKGWFQEGDEQLLNAMMAMTGSILIGAQVTAPDGKGKSHKIEYVTGNLVKVEDLLKGGSLLIYNCTGSTCLSPVPTATTVEGLNERIANMLIGTDSTTGIIEKFATNSGTELTQNEKYFLANLSNGMGAMIRNLSALDSASAYEFTEMAVPYMALDMLKTIVQDLFEAATAASHTSQSSFASDLRKQVMDSKKQITAEFADIRRKHGSMLEIRQYYANIMQSVRHKRYALDLVNLSMQTPTAGEQ